MKKFLTVTTAVAALMLGASGAYALDERKGMYVTGEGESRMVMGGDMTEGARLLVGEGGAAPSDCPAGAYYEVNNQVRPCEGDGTYTLQEPAEGTMMSSGEAYPEGAMMLMQDDEGVEDTTGTDANSDAGGSNSSSN